MQFLRYLPFITATLAAAVPSTKDAANELSFRGEVPGNYSVANMEWRGMPGFDEDHVFTGTIENVVDQMRAIKGSGYTPEFMIDAGTAKQGPTAKPTYHSNNGGDHYVTCGGADANAGRIKQGITYLSNLPDSAVCSMSPGPKTCGRISCSWNSGIWWCNDKTVSSDVYPCSMFAIYAQEILDNCAIYDSNPRVAGINYDNGYDFTVEVKEARC